MLISSVPQKTKVEIPKEFQKECIKYLGIYIDKPLNWSSQIQHINNKVSENLGVLFKLHYYLNLKMLKQIYYSQIYPYLQYGMS